MTDKDGRRRRITIPPGMIDPSAWQMVKSKAINTLPPQMAEMAEKSTTPFVQCITDCISPKNLYMGDKVVFIGDALAGFRPHTVASTSQAAFDALKLAEWLDGTIDRSEFVREVMQYARLYVKLRLVILEHVLISYAESRVAVCILVGSLCWPRFLYITANKGSTGNRSQFESLSVEEYIEDRNMMSIKHDDLDFPAWTRKGLA